MNNARFYAIGDFDTVTRSFVVIASTRDAVPATYWDEDGNQRDRIESLESWDLTRFLKNPLILAVHDDKQIASIIGKASEIQVTDRGLEMRITLLPLYEEPATEAIERKIRGGSLRGVSVGFTYGTERKELRDGQEVSVFTDNALNEVSVVPIPADQDALVDTEETRAAKAAEAQRAKRGLGYIDPSAEDQKRKARSEAGKLLRGARQPKLDRSDTGRNVHFDSYGKLGKVQRTQVGGIRVRARLTRVGVLKYLQRDGSVSRQLRVPEEVFDAESLASLKGVPVTDHAHHTALISAHNFRDAALGHVEDVWTEGPYVEATLVVNDAKTAEAIERGELSDISCGYTCKHDDSPGTFDGEPYDLIHRGIRYNHVALLAPGKGRAGPEVRIQLDSQDGAATYVCLDEDKYMAAPNEQTKTLIKLDGKDYEYGSTSHIEKLDSLHTAELGKARGELTALKSQHEVLKGKFDAAEAEMETAKKAMDEGKKSFKDQLKSAVSSRVKLLRKALRFATEEEGDDEEMEGEDEEKVEKKMDALDGLSDREIMVKCLNATEAFREVKFDGKSDDYVLGLFEHATKSLSSAKSGSVDSVVHAHQRVTRLDAKDPEVQRSLKHQQEQAKNPPWKQPLQVSKG
jgi:HK97 family phage prohead protease